MKIIKVPITEQNKELYHSSSKSKLNKKNWESLLNKCQSMTAKEFWLNEWGSYSESDIPIYWFFVEGPPESIVDELIRLKLGEIRVVPQKSPGNQTGDHRDVAGKRAQ